MNLHVVDLQGRRKAFKVKNLHTVEPQNRRNRRHSLILWTERTNLSEDTSSIFSFRPLHNNSFSSYSKTCHTTQMSLDRLSPPKDLSIAVSRYFTFARYQNWLTVFQIKLCHVSFFTMICSSSKMRLTINVLKCKPSIKTFQGTGLILLNNKSSIYPLNFLIFL